MKPEDDPWLRNAHANAELLEREIRTLVSLTVPIREDRPIVTKYQDFWNRAKQITAQFKELKPLAKSDRELLWKQFNALCLEVKEKQKAEYGTLESLSQKHLDGIMKLAALAELPAGTRAGIHELVERGQALKNASDQLARFKHAMIAKHKKASFDRIQAIRKTHDAAWALVKTGKPTKEKSEVSFRARMNLTANYERYKKAQGALENFRIGRDHIRHFLATSRDPVKIASAKAQLAETEARIQDISEGIRKLERWIAEDENVLKGK